MPNQGMDFTGKPPVGEVKVYFPGKSHQTLGTLKIMKSKEAKIVAEYIQNLGADFEWHDTPFPYNHMGASIIDAALQAGINYDSVVRPRVESVLKKYPNETTVSSFVSLFSRTNLSEIMDWTSETKLMRAMSIFIFFLKEGVETESDLYEWIKNDKNCYALMRIKGVKDKTLDYFKLLSGHSTVAVDRHLINFISQAGVDESKYSDVHEILTKTAIELGVEAKLLDHSIWKYMAEKTA